MLQLIYASAATVHFSEDDLVELLRIARVNNSKVGVTGMLVYQDGAFLQILEGEEEAVRQVYEKIEGDARHNNVKLLLRSEIEERSFGEWQMGFFDATGEQLECFPGFCDFFRSNQPFGNEEIDRARSVLLKFKEGAWHQKALA